MSGSQGFLSSPRFWRWAFGVYLLALTTATHWPALVLGPEVPATDKEIHVAAFALFTFLLWRTGWIRSIWLNAVVVLLWAGIDEGSQAIPVLHRTACWPDYAANVIGIGLMTLAIGLWRWLAVRRATDTR